MKTTTALLSLGLLLGTSTAALADNNSERKTEVTDAAGTTVKSNISHSETTGWTGNKKSETSLERTTDPKGLNNKTKESLNEVSVHKGNGDTSMDRTTVDAAGTERKVTDEVKARANWGKGTTTTSTHREITDPKGLGNKSTAEITEEVNRDGKSVTKTTTKRINGEKTVTTEHVD